MQNYGVEPMRVRTAPNSIELFLELVLQIRPDQVFRKDTPFRRSLWPSSKAGTSSKPHSVGFTSAFLVGFEFIQVLVG